MLKITPFTQTDSSRCGPAVIKMVLDYYGIKVTEDAICQRCGWTFELGCTNDQMKAAIESYGLDCVVYNNSTLEDVKYWLNQGIPVIVDWFTPGADPSLGDMPNGHSSIIVDVDNKYVHLMDPEIGKVRKILREEFMRVWFDWEQTLTIQSWEDMVIRQAMIVQPAVVHFDTDYSIFSPLML